MRLSAISIRNFRSIKAVENIRLEALQAFVGENNAGKSNVLRAVQCFLSPGSGGMTPSDFNNPKQNASIECEFTDLTDNERKKLRQYLLGGRVILRKEIEVVADDERGKISVKATYHGYQAEPERTYLSIKKIGEKYGDRPKWAEIARDAGLPDYFFEDGKSNKSIYSKALERYLLENEVEYDRPVLGDTQALGIPQNLLSALPEFYLLPAITDYSNEIDRRSSSTIFRKLMGDLSDRLLRVDPRYQEIEEALNRVRVLLNSKGENGTSRLTAIDDVESQICEVIKCLMPSVQGVSLSIDVEQPKDIFSKGVTIKVDDGVLTDVLDKGHGMQRSLVFSLLQMLIQTARKSAGIDAIRPILLAIEEPELYIHPHCQRLIFSVLKGFSGINEGGGAQGCDQVIYTTHSPAFIEIANYERIAVVRKQNQEQGSVVHQCPVGVLGDPAERKAFKLLTSFGLRHNELFFARDAILVEGPEDEVGIIATARKLGRIKELPDEIGLSIVVTDGKGDVAKFQKVLNAFGFNYGVLLEMDGKPENDKQTAPILENLKGNRIAKVPNRVEDLLKVGRHFDDQRHAKEFFSIPDNINEEMELLVKTLLPA